MVSEYHAKPLETRVMTLQTLRDQGHSWKEIAEMLGTCEAVVFRDRRKGVDMANMSEARRRHHLVINVGEQAACASTKYRAFTENPYHNPPAALNAIAICGACPITEHCTEIVGMDDFDGVAAGKAWVGGREVTKRVQQLAARKSRAFYDLAKKSYVEVLAECTCRCGGDVQGVAWHTKRDEKPCAWSLQARNARERPTTTTGRAYGAQGAPPDFARVEAFARESVGSGLTLIKTEKIALVMVLNYTGYDDDVIGEWAGMHRGTVRNYRKLVRDELAGLDEDEMTKIKKLSETLFTDQAWRRSIEG